MTAHPHYLAMARYAEDAAISETPWEFWEYRNRGDSVWRPVNLYPMWLSSVEYRRKPRTITISADLLRELCASDMPPNYSTIEKHVCAVGYNHLRSIILASGGRVE